MRLLGLIFTLCLSVAHGAPEVRAYRMTQSELDRVCAEMIEGERPQVEEVKEAGFRSSFFDQAGKRLSYTSSMKAILGPEFVGEALYLPKREVLVMQADVAEHALLAEIVQDRHPTLMRAKVSVFQGPGEREGPSFDFVPPEDLKLLSSISFTTVPGVQVSAASSDQRLKVEYESQIDANGDIVEILLDLGYRGKTQTKSFSLKTGLTLPLGVGSFMKVGSSEGKSAYFVGLEIARVTPSGYLTDEWILDENGKVFLKEQRLARLREVARTSEDWESLIQDDKDVVKVFQVPPTFFNWLGWEDSEGNVVDDPFAPDDPEEREAQRAKKKPTYQGNHLELRKWKPGSLWDAREALMMNGVAFRKQDFAVLSKEGGVLTVKLPFHQMMLVEGLFGHGPVAVRMIAIELVRWQGGEAGVPGGDRVLERMAFLTVPGQSTEVRLGLRLGQKRAGSVEAQIDANDEMIECRFNLATKDLEKPQIRSHFSLRNGGKMVVQEEVTGGQRRAWVATARVVRIPEDVLDSIRKTK